jgi:anti-sigma B factor antagonist
MDRPGCRRAADRRRKGEVMITKLSRGNTSERSEPSMPVFAISQQELDKQTSVIAVEGELDLASAPSLKWTLVDQLRAGYGRLVLDLSLVTFMDSTALGVLVGVERSLNAGERLGIACPQPDVMKIFELTGLDGTFSIFSTVDEALAFARGG